jgi:hypothetical protein
MPNNQALQVFYGTIPLILAVIVLAIQREKQLEEIRHHLNQLANIARMLLDKRLGSMQGQQQATYWGGQQETWK